MFSFKVTVKSKEKKYMPKFVRGLFLGVTRCCILTQRAMKQVVGVGGGDPHVPSLPGEPPRRDTGNLTSSIDYWVEAQRYITGGYSAWVHGAIGSELHKLMKVSQIKRKIFKLKAKIGSMNRFSVKNKSNLSLQKTFRSVKANRGAGQRRKQVLSGFRLKGKLALDIKRNKKRDRAISKLAKLRQTTMPEYAFYLEHGTKRMAPRPYLQRSLDKAQPDFINQMRKGMKAVGLSQ